MNGLGAETLKKNFKPTIVYDFLEIKYSNKRTDVLEKLGLILKNYEVPSGYNMLNTIESAFEFKVS